MCAPGNIVDQLLLPAGEQLHAHSSTDTLAPSKGFFRPVLRTFMHTLPRLPARLSRWHELLQVTGWSHPVSVNPTLDRDIPLTALRRPPSVIAQAEDGYVMGTYGGTVVHVPVSQCEIASDELDLRTIATCSVTGAPATAIAHANAVVLVCGFRNGEVYVNDRLSWTMPGSVFPTSIAAAGPCGYEHAVTGMSSGAVAIYDIQKGMNMYSASLNHEGDDVSHVFSHTYPTVVAMLPSFGCICATHRSSINLVDGRVSRRAPCLTISLGDNRASDKRMETITSMASFPWGGVAVGTQSSAIHLLDLTQKRPEESAHTVLIHTGPVKALSAASNVLISGSARRLARHTVSKSGISTCSYKNLNAALCGLCPSAAALFSKHITGVPS